MELTKLLRLVKDKIVETGKVPKEWKKLRQECLKAEDQLSVLMRHDIWQYGELRVLADVHNTLGICYHIRKEYCKAVDEYKRSIGLGPNWGLDHFNLGILYQKQGRYKEAETEYRRTLLIRPDFEDANERLNKLQALMEKQG